MKEPFYQYVDGVLSGKLVVGGYIRLAVERFVKDCDRKDFIFDFKAGSRIVDFTEKFCRHWKGPKANKPIVLEPHQHFYWIQKYGWMNTATGLPRFRRSVKMIGRKQYKTTEAAIEGLFHMAKGIDHPAQVFTCATKEDDAVIVVNDAGRIAMASPQLKGRYRVYIHEPYVRRVIYEDSFMTYMTKGHDAVDISMGIGDECHDWPDAGIKNRIESAMGNRLAPIFSTITTAGFDKSGYCFGTLRDTAIKILNGNLEDDEQLILIYELDAADDWKDMDMWVKANPNLNYSPTHKPYLESEFKKAMNEGGTTEVNFKTKNLNMWCDAPSVWIQSETWDKNYHKRKVDDLEGRECYGALQIISSKEMNAFCLIFPDFKGTSAVKPLFWMPADIVSKNNLNTDFGRWVRDGYIQTCPGNVIDNDFIFEKLMEEIRRYQMHSLSYPVNQEKHDIVQALIKSGIVCNPISQGYRAISEPTFSWEGMVTAGEVEHFNNPVLKWSNSNTMAVRKGDEIRIERSGSKTAGIVAAVNALAQWKSIEATQTDDKLISSW